MKRLSQVLLWSAVPTPLTPELRIDEAAVERMVEDAIRAGVQGFFLAGTCGEGPWLPDSQKERLVRLAVKYTRGRLRLAVQVSDNSVPRVLDNARAAAQWGADYAVIAPPATFMNATAERITRFYAEAVQQCPLPVGLYDLGRHRAIEIPEAALLETYLLPNVALVKDSSGSPARREIALAARRQKPALHLFNGDEFRCLEYLRAGYNGVMFGGVASTAQPLRRVIDLFSAGQMAEAEAADAELRRILKGIYGGENIACWLTGLKYCLVRQGIFTTPSSFLGYPLTDECRAFIDRYVAGLAGR